MSTDQLVTSKSKQLGKSPCLMPSRENRINYGSVEFLLLRQPTCCCCEVKPVSCRAPVYVGTLPPLLKTCVLVAMGVPTHWPPFALVAKMMEAVCVGMCGCGCGGNKSNVLATLMNTVDHMTVTCSMWEVARLSCDHLRSSQ